MAVVSALSYMLKYMPPMGILPGTSLFYVYECLRVCVCTPEWWPRRTEEGIESPRTIVMDGYGPPYGAETKLGFSVGTTTVLNQ